jgi:hypothetical protein
MAPARAADCPMRHIDCSTQRRRPREACSTFLSGKLGGKPIHRLYVGSVETEFSRGRAPWAVVLRVKDIAVKFPPRTAAL